MIAAIALSILVAVFLAAIAGWQYPAALLGVILLIPAFGLRLAIFGVPTNVPEIAMATVVVLGALQPTVRQSWTKAWQQLPTPFKYLVGLFIAAAISSTVISQVPRVSFGILKGWIIFPLVFGWLVYAAVSWQPRFARYVMGTLILSGTIVSLLALAQWQAGERLRGIYDTPNSLALWLAPLLVMVIWLWVHKGVGSRLALVGVIPMAIALVATQSVSGISAVCIALVVGALSWSRGIVRRRLIFGLLVSLSIAAAYLGWSGRLQYLVMPLRNPTTHNSISVRLQLWSVSLDLIKQHPLLGIGLGQFEPAYQHALHERFANGNLQITNYKSPISEFVFRDPHNWLLSFWLNTGLLGLASFVGTHVYLFGASRKLQITNYKSQITILALLTILLFGLTDTIYWKNDLAALHMVLIALFVSANTYGRTSRCYG